ncbi:hypothetical protein NIES22_59410 [Calothrix brevissima NIES-22]|nr:hypothetical protein NIES22_59410 [Calothrix brevissima NIES-22]
MRNAPCPSPKESINLQLNVEVYGRIYGSIALATLWIYNSPNSYRVSTQLKADYLAHFCGN